MTLTLKFLYRYLAEYVDFYGTRCLTRDKLPGSRLKKSYQGTSGFLTTSKTSHQAARKPLVPCIFKFKPALRRVLLKFKKKEKKINQIVY